MEKIFEKPFLESALATEERSYLCCNEKKLAFAAPGQRFRISTGLVEKWRSIKGRHVPSDPFIAQAFVEALQELGLFGISGDSQMEHRQLMTLLDYDFKPTKTHRVMTELKQAYDEVLETLKNMDSDELVKLSDWRLLLAASCRLSQEALRGDEIWKNKQSIVLLLRWDVGANAKAQKNRGVLRAELENSKVKAFLSDLLKEGWDTHVIVGWYLETSDTPLPEAKIDEIQTDLKRFFSVGLGADSAKTSAPSAIHFHSCSVPLTRGTAQDLWILLGKGAEDVRIWALQRHTDLYQITKDTQISTFCSPLPKEEADVILALLGIECRLGGRWQVSPEGRVSDQLFTSNQAAKNV